MPAKRRRFNWATACQPWERRHWRAGVEREVRQFQLGHGVSAVGTNGPPALERRSSGKFQLGHGVSAVGTGMCNEHYHSGKARFNWATACQPWERLPGSSCRPGSMGFQLGHGVSAVGTPNPRAVAQREVVSFNWATACQPWERQLSRMYAGGRRSRFQLGHGVSAVGTVGIGSSSRDTTYKGIFEQQVLRVKREKKSKGGAVATGCPAMT